MRKSIFALALVVWILLLPAACSTEGQARVLPALHDLGLKGSLIFLVYHERGSQLVKLDLSTGKLDSLFDVPDQGYLGEAAVSPDGKQIVMSYAPPPSGRHNQYGITDLFLLPLGGTIDALQPLTHRQADLEVYNQPSWSADGAYLYYTHLFPKSGSLSSDVQIERIRSGGKPQVLYAKAIWPSLSPDGSQIAYLTQGGLGVNQLYLGSSDGSGSRPILPAGLFSFVDAHFFTPDGKAIVFSASSQVNVSSEDPGEGTPLLGGFFGVTPVSAHPQPSDWYEVTLADGRVRRLAHPQDINLYGAFSPDGMWIGYVSQRGAFVMKADGSSVTRIASLFGMGSVSWVN